MQSRVNNEKIMNSLIVEAILSKSESTGLDVELIERAYRFAEESVGKCLRDSDGTSVIGHYIRVVAILTLELNLVDSDAIAAGFLHSLVSYTDITYQMLEDKFGKQISNLVRLFKASPDDDEEQKVVIQRLQESPEGLASLIKLADRLDNIRRLRFANQPEKRARYIQQTENLYVPFAKKMNPYIYDAMLSALQRLKAQHE